MANLSGLDPKLWAALSCPVRGLECDEATLALIDADGDGIVRAPELLAAIEWTASRLRGLDTLTDGNPNLPLAAIDASRPQGALLAKAAREILANLGKEGAAEIAVEETGRRAEIFGRARFNGDGVVPPSAAEDPETALAIKDVLACLPGRRDRNGEPGVDRATLEAFFGQLEAYLDWSGQQAPEATPVGYEAYLRLKDKIDDYFSRCRLVAFDERAEGPLDRAVSQYAAIAQRELAELPPSIKELPLARPRADLRLAWDGPLNPAWERELADFRAAGLDQMEGGAGEALSLEEWNRIKERFAAMESRETEAARFAARHLPAARIRELLERGVRSRIEGLLDQDEALADEVAAIDDLDRLARYHRDLHLIVRNFVNFEDFFSMRRSASFQSGRLYIDGRSCELCVRVGSPVAHATLAALSRCYLLYCECRRAGQEPMTVVAALTEGDADHLMVGRNGVFFDRKGRDWQAAVVKIVDNPISIRQAFLSPYKKFARFVDAQLTKRAEAAEQETSKRLASAAEATAHADRAPPPSKPAKIEVGAVAAIGVALGSIGTFASIIVIRAIEMGPWLPAALLAVALMISLPSMFLAWIRLRQRTLGPILDANGWAVNGQIKINARLARSLTGRRRLPPGSAIRLKDPYGGRGRGWLWAALVAAALAGSAAVGYWMHRQGWWELPWEAQAAEAAETKPTAGSAE